MIHSRRQGILSVELSNDQHSIISDVALNVGGEDSGLNPHELVEAALAACTSMTLELYAKRKNWDVSEMKVEIKIIKEGPESVIERKIFFGNLPEEQKVKLLEISDKCPISKLLESNIKIESHEKRN
jgi:putative redox protein